MKPPKPVVLPARLEIPIQVLAAHQGLTVPELLHRLAAAEVRRTRAALDPFIAELLDGKGVVPPGPPLP